MENKENAVTTLPFEDSLPDWFDGKRINEVLFCQQFLDKHPMKCVRGRLFTVDGLIEDEGQIGNLILEEISSCLTSGLSKVVANLLASIKLQAYSPPLPIETDRIHVANGTYFMDGRFSADKSYCNKSSGTPWRKTKRPRTAALRGSSSQHCRESLTGRRRFPLFKNMFKSNLWQRVCAPTLPSTTRTDRIPTLIFC